MLYYYHYGEGKETLVILHGLLGAAKNWQPIATAFAKDRQVLCFDLPNHGGSCHQTDMRYEFIAEQIHSQLQALGINKIQLLGHSLGGKLAMVMADLYPKLVSHLVVVDIAARHYPDEHSHIIQALMQLPLDNHSRKALDLSLATTIKEKKIRQFLLMNLVHRSGKWHWQVNLHNIWHAYSYLISAIPERSHLLSYQVLVIHAVNSTYIEEKDLQALRVRYPNMQAIEFNTGHWVQHDASAAFVTTVNDFLS